MPKHRLTFGYGSCRSCQGWGELRSDGACWPCALWGQKITDPRPGACRRCTREAMLTYDEVCRPCMIEIHYVDHDWIRAQQDGGVAPRRPLQLALLLPEVKFALLQPLHKRGGGPNLNLLPSTRDWRSANQPPALADDPRVCPPQIRGQTALLTMRRIFRPGDGRRIAARTLPEDELLDQTARRLQSDLGRSPRWAPNLMPQARLALAAREADEDQVREEDLDALTGRKAAVTQVLREAGLLRPRTEPKTRTHPRRTIGPRRPRADAKPPRPAGPRPPRTLRSCEGCWAWTGTSQRNCDACQSWARAPIRTSGVCSRCGREQPLAAGRCRACRLAVAAGSPDGVVMDQLWLGRSGYRPTRPAEPELPAAPPTPFHLDCPGQHPLFPAPQTQWAGLLGKPLPELTPAAADLVRELDRTARAQAWGTGTRLANRRVLRAAVAYLGAEEPITETDVRAIARLGSNYAGLRVAHFLEARGLLIPRPDRDIGMDQAAVTRLIAAAPARYQGDLDAWVSDVRGNGRRRSVPIEWASVRRYVGYVLPVLAEWEPGFASLTQVDRADILDALKERPGPPGPAVFCGLRSLFRSLKRERRIFHDPARTVHLGSRPQFVPRPIPDAELAGILDRAPTPFGKLVVALVAIHAVRTVQLTALTVTDLDRSQGRLMVGGRTVYLDAVTLRLLGEWLKDRHRQWPFSTNPHLLVTRRTAMHAEHPPVNKYAIHYVFRTTGLKPQAVAIDRVLDEADHSEDPLHLMKVFDLSVSTAVKYVQAAHPERCVIDAIQA
ncbi:hypothetical protein [Kitasatospora sp. MBT63]|uniref:hypothetical protein n=1 Tax=Kitasatospora sp. MBT63 TaxID=1444768 RepID=UPI00053AE45A|nr:hypothetical protein [Kitasatospora sp. MBT63]